MFTRPYRFDRFVASVLPTVTFARYCQWRGLPHPDSADWWGQVSNLPGELTDVLTFELGLVNELAGYAGLTALQAYLPDLRPPAGLLRGPAMALWYFLEAPDLVRQMYLRWDPPAGDTWTLARTTPGLVLPADEVLEDRYRGMLTTLGCEPHELEVLHDPGRVTLLSRRWPGLDSPAASAELSSPLRFHVQYHTDDGTVLVFRSHTTHDQVTDWLQELSAVFGAPVEQSDRMIDLSRLQDQSLLLADDEDMSPACVRVLHLATPPEQGGRVVKIESRTNDRPEAIQELLDTHLPAPSRSYWLTSYAEVQCSFLTRLGQRTIRLRLWPNRSTLLQTALGVRLRKCLIRWGLLYAE
jgi:hypothetical protein